MGTSGYLGTELEYLDGLHGAVASSVGPRRITEMLCVEYDDCVRQDLDRARDELVKGGMGSVDAQSFAWTLWAAGARGGRGTPPFCAVPDVDGFSFELDFPTYFLVLEIRAAYANAAEEFRGLGSPAFAPDRVKIWQTLSHPFSSSGNSFLINANVLFAVDWMPELAPVAADIALILQAFHPVEQGNQSAALNMLISRVHPRPNVSAPPAVRIDSDLTQLRNSGSEDPDDPQF